MMILEEIMDIVIYILYNKAIMTLCYYAPRMQLMAI